MTPASSERSGDATPITSGDADASAATVRATGTLLLVEDETETTVEEIDIPTAGLVGVLVATAVTVVFGIVPGPLLDMAHTAATFLPH